MYCTLAFGCPLAFLSALLAPCSIVFCPCPVLCGLELGSTCCPSFRLDGWAWSLGLDRSHSGRLEHAPVWYRLGMLCYGCIGGLCLSMLNWLQQLGLCPPWCTCLVMPGRDVACYATAESICPKLHYLGVSIIDSAVPCTIPGPLVSPCQAGLCVFRSIAVLEGCRDACKWIYLECMLSHAHLTSLAAKHSIEVANAMLF